MIRTSFWGFRVRYYQLDRVIEMKLCHGGIIRPLCWHYFHTVTVCLFSYSEILIESYLRGTVASFIRQS